MRKGLAITLAAFGGLIGGFVVYEMIAVIMVRTMSSIPWGLLHALPLVLPFAGAVTAALLIQRRYGGKHSGNGTPR